MKVVAIIEYGPDQDQLRALHPAHRDYLRGFLESGQLRAAGPFAEDAGALWVLGAESAQAAEEIVRVGPVCRGRGHRGLEGARAGLLVGTGSEGSAVTREKHDRSGGR